MWACTSMSELGGSKTCLAASLGGYEFSPLLGFRLLQALIVGFFVFCFLGLQVFLRVFCSIVMLIAEATHRYKEGDWNPQYFYVWATV